MVIFGARVHTAGGDALHLAHHQVQPLVALLRVGNPHIRHGKRIELVDRLARVARTPGRLAARHDHFDIRMAQARQAHAPRQHLGDLLGAEACIKAETLATAGKARQMRIEPEKSALPHRDNVVGGVGTQETPVGDGDGSLANRHVLAAHVRDPLGIIG